MLAREAARQEPHLIRRIVTFGSPVVGGPRDPQPLLSPQKATDPTSRRRAITRIPLPVPVTSIWSANDGIVSPAACIDRRHPDVENVEVTSSHLGMGFDPDVWRVVARRLAARRNGPQRVMIHAVRDDERMIVRA